MNEDVNNNNTDTLLGDITYSHIVPFLFRSIFVKT